MIFEPLSILHQEPINEALKRLLLPLSEYNFTTLYLFRNDDQYCFLRHPEGEHWVRGVSRNGEVFLMPLFHPSNWQDCVNFGRSLNAKYLFPITEEWSDELTAFRVRFDEDEADYCFDRESIQAYSGRHYDGQRNWVKRLLKTHKMRVEPYQEEFFGAADTIIEEWCHGKTNGCADASECREGIQLANKLGLQGYLFFADEKPVGLIFGEPLLNDMFLIHFAKAVNGCLGIYPYMYQELAKRLPNQYRWLNWEQDLGIEKLRMAKREYHPIRFSKKARLFVQ
jgi:uncharacterized protein